jgi:hypothetical protein
LFKKFTPSKNKPIWVRAKPSQKTQDARAARGESLKTSKIELGKARGFEEEPYETRLEKANKAINAAKKGIHEVVVEAKKQISTAGNQLIASIKGLPEKIQDRFKKKIDYATKEVEITSMETNPKTIKTRLTKLAKSIKFPTLSTELDRKPVIDAIKNFKKQIIKTADKLSGAAAAEKAAKKEVADANREAEAKAAAEKMKNQQPVVDVDMKLENLSVDELEQVQKNANKEFNDLDAKDPKDFSETETKRYNQLGILIRDINAKIYKATKVQ